MDPQLQQLVLQLSEAAVRNTASVVADRVGMALRAGKNEKAIAQLEAIINDLVDDKNDLVRIARSYEEQMVAQRLSEADVRYMTDNLLPVLRHIGALQSGDAEELLVTLGPLLSAQTFTILQLLGFNFQKAIGEPLTNLVGAWIGSVERRTTSPGGRPSPQPSAQPQRRK